MNWMWNETYEIIHERNNILKNIGRVERKELKYLDELIDKQNMWNKTRKKEYSKEYWEGWKKRAKILGSLGLRKL